MNTTTIPIEVYCDNPVKSTAFGCMIILTVLFVPVFLSYLFAMEKKDSETTFFVIFFGIITILFYMIFFKSNRKMLFYPEKVIIESRYFKLVNKKEIRVSRIKEICVNGQKHRNYRLYKTIMKLENGKKLEIGYESQNEKAIKQQAEEIGKLLGVAVLINEIKEDDGLDVT